MFNNNNDDDNDDENNIGRSPFIQIQQNYI